MKSGISTPPLWRNFLYQLPKSLLPPTSSIHSRKFQNKAFGNVRFAFHPDTSLHTFSHELKDINYNLCACPNRNSTKIATPCKDHINPMDHLKIRTEDEDGEKFLFHIFLVLSFDFGARDIFVCLCRGWLAFF